MCGEMGTFPALLCCVVYKPIEEMLLNSNMGLAISCIMQIHNYVMFWGDLQKDVTCPISTPKADMLLVPNQHTQRLISNPQFAVLWLVFVQRFFAP
jgi:hypothetical protein